MGANRFRLPIMVAFCLSPGMLCVNGDDQGMEASFFKFVGDMAHAFHSSNCEFTCPPEASHQVADPHHVPSSNGCGSYGVQIPITDFPQLTRCCDSHDKCYDTCGSVKDSCDETFKSCLLGVCDKLVNKKRISDKTHDDCTKEAKAMFEVVDSFGCPAYTSAQQNACLCVPPRR